MPQKLKRIQHTQTKSGKLRARCPDHGIISHKTVGATEAGPIFECHPIPGGLGLDHIFVRPWAPGERLNVDH